MIRIMVVLWTVLAAGVGVSLFLLKHEVQSLEDELNRVNRDIQASHEDIHVLKAEWSYLNDPARLRRLAETHLQMSALKPEQVTTVAAMPAALMAAEQGLPFTPAASTGRRAAGKAVAVAHQVSSPVKAPVAASAPAPKGNKPVDHKTAVVPSAAKPSIPAKAPSGKPMQVASSRTAP